jgi:hypothetical protein
VVAGAILIIIGLGLLWVGLIHHPHTPIDIIGELALSSVLPTVQPPQHDAHVWTWLRYIIAGAH